MRTAARNHALNLLAGVAGLGLAASAGAAVITFEGVSDSGSPLVIGDYQLTTSASFDLNDVSTDTRLSTSGENQSFTLARVDGLPFDFLSLDLSNFTFNSSFTHGVEIVGNLAGGGTVSNSYFVGGVIPGNRNLEATVPLVGYTGLVSVDFLPLEGANSAPARKINFDDFELVVPEPSALAIVGLAGAGLVRRRR